MISRHFGLRSELSGSIAKRLPHAKILPVSGSFFNQFVTDIYSIYIFKYIHSTYTHKHYKLPGTER